jgi:NAD(P)-dependent dehydrogenase (short-subunit alcohol dehydrogenase family)
MIYESSAASADTPLQRPVSIQSFVILTRVCLRTSRLRVPVSPRVCTLLRRTVVLSCLVHLIYSIYLVFWVARHHQMKHINQINKTNQINRIDEMNQMNSSMTVVVTGASTGIGAACVLDYAARGMTVFAGVRDHRAGEALAAKAGPSLIPITLDVTDERSIMRSVEVVQRIVGEGGLGGLVNNAGIVIGSPLEVIPLAQLRKQLEVNVIGQIAVTQAFLPLLRRGRGRIVNMGSIAGRGTIPLLGPYSASKYALEALTDALRMELHPWGIQVSIIEPGAIATPIWEKSAKEAGDLEASASEDAKALYGEAVDRIREAVAQAAQRAIAPEAVVRAVYHALTSPRPRTRYLVGSDAKLRAWMVKWLPDRVQDRLLAWALKYPGES